MPGIYVGMVKINPLFRYKVEVNGLIIPAFLHRAMIFSDENHMQRDIEEDVLYKKDCIPHELYDKIKLLYN